MTRLIPSIDILDGQVVRLRHGDFQQKTVYDAPVVELARRFAQAGARELHVVDLDGARQGQVVHWVQFEALARLDLDVQAGGGFQCDADVERGLTLGLARIVVGSLAVRDPVRVRRWLRAYGSDRVVIAADVRGGQVTVDAWRSGTSLPVSAFVREYVEAGATRFLCTDVDCDGDLRGPALALYRQLVREFPQVHLTASGGVRSKSDLQALDDAGVAAAVVGRALHEGVFPWDEVKELLC